MTPDLQLDRFRTVPAIVPPVLREVARLRSTGEMSDGDFAVRVERLEREELTPREFDLLIRETAGGALSFHIKARRSGQVYEIIECQAARHIDGQDGFDGVDGKDGFDGAHRFDGADGKDGH